MATALTFQSVSSRITFVCHTWGRGVGRREEWGQENASVPSTRIFGRNTNKTNKEMLLNMNNNIYN
jgi:hypothetical protein